MYRFQLSFKDCERRSEFGIFTFIDEKFREKEYIDDLLRENLCQYQISQIEYLKA